MNTRFDDSVIVRPWIKKKVITILRILGPLAKAVMVKFRRPPHNMAFSQKCVANSSQEIKRRQG